MINFMQIIKRQSKMSSFSYFSYKLISNSSHLRRNYLLLILILINCWIKSTTAINSHVSSSNFPIYMVKSPESAIAPKGDEVQFECELNLEPEKLEWRFRPQNSAINRDSFIVVNKNSGYNVTKTGKLSQMRVYVNQKTVGDYECVAWFGASAITSTSAKLMLATIALNNTSDKNSQGPVVHYKIAPNNSLIVRCGEVISYPPPVWTYFKDNTPLPPNVLQVQSGGLILSQMKKSDSGTYSCLAVNSITGSEIKLPQRINIHVDYTPRTAPTFLNKPVRKFVTKPGESVVLECSGIGNPPPKPVWSRPDKRIDFQRAVIHGYGLVIRDVKPEDQGPYHCRLDNGMINVQDNTVYLAVHEHPIIIDGPKDTLTNETDSLSLQCKAKGSPAPVIYWKINGQDTKWDPLIRSDGSKILIQSVEKRHAGIIQCFAKNEVGETSAANQLRVNPKQIIGQGETYGNRPLGILPHSGHTSNSNESIKPTKRRKKNKNSIMVPPTRPNVSRLSDESVMVRWSVPANDGLPIQFFKVQHRLLGDSAKKVGRSQWKTANEDIPPSVRSYLIDSLKPDHIYRFRIAAVYSNNDNKLSPTSDKFHLLRASQLGPAKSHLPAPNLTNIESLSETEIVIHWTFPNHPSQPVEGFYVYYRPSTTAGEYSKATVEGQSSRHFKIDNLEPGTSYECKIQSFTSATASEFSAILTGRTKKLPTPSPTVPPSVVVAQDSLSLSSTSSMIVPITAGVFGIIILGIVFCVVIIAFKNRKLPTEDETENKTHPDHIQIEANGFAGGGRILNGGVLPRMNITNNPLAQDEKNRNIVELQCVPNSIPKVTADIDLPSLNDTTETTSNKTTNNNCCEPPLSSQSDNKIQTIQQQNPVAAAAVPANLSAIITPPVSATTLGIPSVPNHHYHNNNHHSNNHHNHHHRPTSPHNANRRTLERNNRNNNNKDNNMHQGSMRHHNNHQKHHNYNKSGQQNNQSSTYHYNSNKNYPKNTNHHSKNNNFHGNNNAPHNNGMIDECGLPIGKNKNRRGSNNSVNENPRHRRDSSSERVHNNRQQYQQHNPKRLNSIEV